jgi:tetratricopeptide (TPR) repeat protein
MLNIIASQSVPALYFEFISERKDAVAQTLYKIQRTKEYPEVLSMQRAIYGPSIDAAISQENETRFYNIQQLEKILQLNPRARDVFFALGTLYEEQGDASKSGFFFQKAHEIDPSLK